MRKNIIIWSLLSLLAFALAGCRIDSGLSAPELEVYDASGCEILSLGSPASYSAEYTCWEYTDIAKPDETAEQMPSPKYMVASNMPWRVEPADASGYDWIRPFPASGKGDGMFFFFVDRYSDQTAPRESEWVIVANDGTKDITLGGFIVISQSPSNEFLRKSAARIEMSASSGTKKLIITSNVPWEYEMEPDPDYATENLDWLTVALRKGESMSDTLAFTVPANTNSIRGAKLTLKYVADGVETSEVVPVLQNGVSVDVEGFPLKWTIGVADNNYAESWPAEGLIQSTSGFGTIRYVSIDKTLIDVNKAYKLDINGNDPRAIGVWPGDYCEFLSEMPVAKGTILKISFEARVSASCMKYWRMEYKDGSEWKVAGASMVTEEPGEPVVYTDFFPGGANAAANIQVSKTVKYENTTDKVDFRFICAANWTCSGTRLDNPNGASWRLTMSDRKETNEWQPTIQCIAGGSESIVKADIEVSGVNDKLIVFEGSPESPAVFKVKSDNDFVISADADWLSLSLASGEAGNEYEVSLSCENSPLSVTRRATVDITSGISHYIITVIQSAAGQELQPFISLVGGNSIELENAPGSFDVQVQANVGYEIECSDPWIAPAEEAVATKSLVEYTARSFNYTRNNTGGERTGYVRFLNREYNIESVLVLVQASVSPEVTFDAVEKTIYHDESETSFAVTTNLPLGVEVVEGPFSVSSEKIEPGETVLTVNALSDEASSGKIRVYNDEYGWAQTLTVNRIEAGLLADWLFTKAKKNRVTEEFLTDAGASREEGTMGKAVHDDVYGTSFLEYWSVDKTDGANGDAFKRQVSSAGEPYVTAPWEGDYWLYTINSRSEIKAGTSIRYQFQIRNTNSAQKNWTIEYFDGGEWKPANGATSDKAGISGNVITFPATTGYYSFEGVLTLENATDSFKLRIVAGENTGANGKPVTATATSRMGSENEAFHNRFEIVRQ